MLSIPDLETVQSRLPDDLFMDYLLTVQTVTNGNPARAGEACLDAVEAADLVYLEVALAWGQQWGTATENVCIKAASRGRASVLEFAMKLGCPLFIERDSVRYSASTEACRGGHLSCLRMCYAQPGFAGYFSDCCIAGQYGELDCLRCSVRHRVSKGAAVDFPWLMTLCAASGRANCLEYLLNEHSPNATEQKTLCYYAVRYRNWQCFLAMAGKDDLSTVFLEETLRRGKFFELVQVGMERIKALASYESICMCAVNCRKREYFNWLRDEGFACSDYCLSRAHTIWRDVKAPVAMSQCPVTAFLNTLCKTGRSKLSAERRYLSEEDVQRYVAASADKQRAVLLNLLHPDKGPEWEARHSAWHDAEKNGFI